MKHHLASPPDALGALYFLPGQYLFKRIEDGRESAKALSSEQIARAFREFKADTGWITHRILRYREEPEGNSILTFEPAGIRTIFVESADGEVSEITLPLPTLILFGHKNEFYLWSAKVKNVTNTARLSIAPLPNIGSNMSGKICFGRNEVPFASIETIDQVWNLIFSTPFNGDQSNQKCRSEPEDVRKLLLSLATKRPKRFPSSELIESTSTIEDIWMQAVEKRQHSGF